MKGFFEIEKPLTKPKPKPKLLGCDGCNLYRTAKNPKMPYTGEGRLKAFILSEAPGKTEDEQNKQLVGDAGTLLRDCLIELGYDLDRDFYKQNAIRCRPMDDRGNNRTPTDNEIQYCRRLWKGEVEGLKPQSILLLGAKAIEAYFGDCSHPISSDLSMGRWAGQCIPDSHTGAWVICLYHPSFAVRTPDFLPRFKRDLKWGLEQLEREPPKFIDWTKKIIPITKFELVIELFKNILKRKPSIVIDYETSGIRPYKPGHHIWSIGVYLIGDEIAYAFPYSYPNHWTEKQFKDIEHLFISILVDEEIPKIAQSIQFEESWSRRVIGVPVQGWLHDTMVCSHILNEHRKFTGLDFQVFINFGYEYGEEITPYKNVVVGTDFNRIHEVPLKDLLLYNGLDALFEGMLYQKQVEKLK